MVNTFVRVAEKGGQLSSNIEKMRTHDIPSLGIKKRDKCSSNFDINVR